MLQPLYLYRIDPAPQAAFHIDAPESRTRKQNHEHWNELSSSLQALAIHRHEEILHIRHMN
jgi:hypothetical protein